MFHNALIGFCFRTCGSLWTLRSCDSGGFTHPAAALCSAATRSSWSWGLPQGCWGRSVLPSPASHTSSSACPKTATGPLRSPASHLLHLLHLKNKHRYSFIIGIKFNNTDKSFLTCLKTYSTSEDLVRNKNNASCTIKKNNGHFHQDAKGTSSTEKKLRPLILTRHLFSYSWECLSSFK